MDRPLPSVSTHTGNSHPFRDLHRCLHIRTYSMQEILLEYCLVIVTLGFFILLSLFPKMVKCHFIMSAWSVGVHWQLLCVCRLQVKNAVEPFYRYELSTALEKKKEKKTHLRHWYPSCAINPYQSNSATCAKSTPQSLSGGHNTDLLSKNGTCFYMYLKNCWR